MHTRKTSTGQHLLQHALLRAQEREARRNRGKERQEKFLLKQAMLEQKEIGKSSLMEENPKLFDQRAL